MRKTGFILATLTGMLAGLGFFVFNFGEGFSYFSEDPSTCINCHVMQPHYDSWQKNVHHAFATCNDCHMPADSLVDKMIAKSVNGWNHSKAFTLDNYPEPIRITAYNAEILQANCLRCHQDLVDTITFPHAGLGDPKHAVSCVSCHQDVGHGARW